MIYRNIKPLILLWMLVVGFSAISATVVAAEEMPRIPKEEAKQKLDDPNVVFLDARLGSDWQASSFKIKGAEYIGEEPLEAWSANYDKNINYIVYCA